MIEIPVGHFASDVVLTFEEDVDEVNEAGQDTIKDGTRLKKTRELEASSGMV